MLRGDNIVCGTSTTGTGTLTLAATPGPPGGVDFDVFARATGIGFGNGAVILVSYTIIEYTDATFATAKSHEKGVGTLTLGGSSGITNCTLARTLLQSSATSLNSQPATQNIAPGTGISIGTAANTLVFIGVSAADVPAYAPYVSAGDDNVGCFPGAGGGLSNSTTASAAITNGMCEYTLFKWDVPMLVKRAFARVGTAYSGGTPVSNLYLAIYAIGTDGFPGRLIYDFGGCGANCLNATGSISASQGNGFFLMPGEYYFVTKPVFSGGVSDPSLTLWTNQGNGWFPLNTGRLSSSSGGPVNGYAAFTDTSTTFPTTAFLTNQTARMNYNQKYAFTLRST